MPAPRQLDNPLYRLLHSERVKEFNAQKPAEGLIDLSGGDFRGLDLRLLDADRVILICRSGDRSARAADLLANAGYTQVYSITDGFEGDAAKDGPQAGQRIVNGWKNAGLPWTYKLEKQKMYFPR